MLELGCGTGLAGIYAAKQTQLVKLYQTDYITTILLNTMKNIALNEVGNAQVLKLNWNHPEIVNVPMKNQDSKVNLEKFERIIASDVCYEFDSCKVLAKTINFYLRTGGKCFIVLPKRKLFDKEIKEFENQMRIQDLELLSRESVCLSDSFLLKLDPSTEESDTHELFYSYTFTKI